MKWQAFLRPTLGKILSALALTAMVELAIYFLGATSILCQPCPPPPVECPPCIAPSVGLAWALLALAPVAVGGYLVVCGVVEVARGPGRGAG